MSRTIEEGINAAPLNFWRLRGYTDEDIVEMAREIDGELMAAEIKFVGGGRIEITITQKMWARQEGHYPAIVQFFSELAILPALFDRKGSVLIWCEDGVWEAHEKYTWRAPVLSFGKTAANLHTFVFPDPAFTFSKGYIEDVEKISQVEAAIGFENKKKVVFFRGAAVGPGIEGPNWTETPRARISILSRDLNDASILDAKMTKMDHLPNAQQETLRKAGVIGDYVKFHEFLRYLYLIHADGYHCSWPSLYTKLASDSVVLRIMGHFEQWYYHELIPWKHYVPLAPNLSDFKQVQEWLVKNDEGVRRIIANAHDFLRERLNYEVCLRETAELIGAIFDCRR